jgi:type IV pilus assembly protein PilC
MPTFVYTARDQSGNQTTGTVEADTDSRAVSDLRDRGLWVTDIKSGGRPAGGYAAPVQDKSVLKSMWSPVSLKDLSLFYRQLHTLLNSGTALYGSLEMLGRDNQTPNTHLRKAIVSLGQHVLTGGRLSDGMRRFPWLFDKMQVRLVEAGEAGGLLVEILRRLADYLQKDYELRLEIKRKTLYPKLLLIALFVLPSIPTLVIAGPQPFFLEMWGKTQVLLIGGMILYFFFKALLATEGGRNFYDQAKLMIPVVGGLVRKLVVARFARTLAALYGAGVPIAHGVVLAGESSGNYVLETSIRRVSPAIERGMTISATLDSTRFFQPMVIGMIQTGETTGGLDEILNKAAEFYEEEAMHATIQLTVILGVVLLLIMGLLIAIKIISFYVGHYSGPAGGAADGVE